MPVGYCALHGLPMPLKCLRGTEEVYAFEVESDEEWTLLRSENTTARNLRMPCCGAAVVLRTSPLGTRHFAHVRRGPCTTAPETAEHLLAKIVIIEGIRRTAWTAKPEQEGSTPSGDQWKADVLAIKDNTKTKAAFEVQWSRQTDEETRQRQTRYKNAGVRGLWLFRQHDFPVEKDVPAFRLIFDEKNKSFLVAIPSPFYHPNYVSSREKDKPLYWQQTVELSRFVEGALTGKLHFGAALNKKMPLEVEAAATECWRCHKETSIFTGLVFAAGKTLLGCPNIHASIYSFDNLGPSGGKVLNSILPPKLLREHGIGVLKSRYSKMEGKSYLSNGCAHCDVLQGKNFDHEVAYDSEKVFDVEVVLDATWATQLLGDSSHLYRWWFDDSF
jgi:competence protein CoiA